MNLTTLNAVFTLLQVEVETSPGGQQHAVVTLGFEDAGRATRSVYHLPMCGVGQFMSIHVEPTYIAVGAAPTQSEDKPTLH